MKKIYWISGLIIVLVIAGYFGYRTLKSKGAAAATAIQTSTVERGTIASSLNAAGTVRTGQSAIITWQTSGKVADILVNLGDPVDVDQELATLDPNFLSPSIINAQQNLIDAKIALDDLLNSKTQQAQAQGLYEPYGKQEPDGPS